MASFRSGHKVGKDLCEAFGIDPQYVKKLVIIIEPRDVVVTVEVHRYTEETRLKAIEDYARENPGSFLVVEENNE